MVAAPPNKSLYVRPLEHVAARIGHFRGGRGRTGTGLVRAHGESNNAITLRWLIQSDSDLGRQVGTIRTHDRQVGFGWPRTELVAPKLCSVAPPLRLGAHYKLLPQLR